MVTWSQLFDVCRGGITERTIHGSIAIIDGRGRVWKTKSDPACFGRSLMKPFQMKAIARELDGLLTGEQKAVALASQMGEEAQVKAVKSLAAERRLESLVLPEVSPMGRSDGEKSRFVHPCSGKHLAILAACEAKDWPLETYTSVEHPYNQAYSKLLEARLGYSLERSVVAPDGCELPTWTLPISDMARLFAGLARDRDEDWIWSTFREFPEYIGGMDRLDTKLMQAEDRLIAKEGADGLIGVSVAGEDGAGSELGVVIKLAHGYDPQVMGNLIIPILSALRLRVPEWPKFAGQEIRYAPEFVALLESLGPLSNKSSLRNDG